MKKCILVDAFRARYWKMVGHSLKQPEEMHRGYDKRKENCRMSTKLLYRTN